MLSSWRCACASSAKTKMNPNGLSTGVVRVKDATMAGRQRGQQDSHLHMVPARNLQICLSKELRRVLRSECAYCTRRFTKPSIQDATEYISMDAKSDIDESTRPRGPFLIIDTLLSSFLLPLESDAPLRFNKHTWHCPVFSLFSPFHSQGVAAAKNTA